MLKLLETLKDSAESTFDSAASRVENVHRIIGGYVGHRARGLRGRRAASASDEANAPNIYDVIRGVNREIGEFGTDVFEILDDARARRRVDHRARDDD